MSDSDKSEWRLYDATIQTQLCILPIVSSHMLFVLNKPGSGEIKIPLDSAAAPQIAEGTFCALYYRGALRMGFFVENIQQVDADSNEGGGRLLSASGRGAMTVLEEVIVWSDPTATNETKRTFTSVSKASILNTLINERFDRGAWAIFDWDFSDTYDSASVAWTDSESIELNVGMTLLDVVEKFANTGEMEFEITLQNTAHPLLFRAWKNGIGSDKSETIYMRIGTNCQEVSRDQRGGKDLKNASLVKYKGGYITVTDSTSITAYRRRENLINIEEAQSGDSASTFASAQLADTKDPTNSIVIRVYDGIKPYLFVDYIMGDTVTLDRFGTESTYRILGLQADFSADDFSSVELTTNALIYEDDLRMRNELDELRNRWNTAQDADQLEVKKWMTIGQPNGEVYSLYNDGTYLYVGGNFTEISGTGIAASYIARYEFATGAWSAMGSAIAQIVRGITGFGGNIYQITTDKIYKWNGSTQTLIGTGATTTLKAIANDGTNLYVGGTLITSIDAVTCAENVMKYNGSVWSDVAGVASRFECHSLLWWSGKLYGGFSVTNRQAAFRYYNSGWTNVWSSSVVNTSIGALADRGDTIVMLEEFTQKLWESNGTQTSPTVLGTVTYTSGVNQDREALAVYLTDVFIGAEFGTIDGITGYNNIARYSGGTFSYLGAGFSTATGARHDRISALSINGSDVYAGGLFTTADGQTIANLAVWVTSFDSMIDHLDHDGSFDLGAAIHNATVGTLTDADEMGFWEDTAAALRKITWANIKSTLKTYFDTLYLLAAAQTNADDIFLCVSPGGVSAFAGTINGTPSGATLVYNVTSGQEAAMKPSVTTQLAKMRLYNTTRGTSLLISDCNTGTNTLTFTANVPGAWVNTDVITIASQTTSGGGFSWVDFEITSGPTGKTAMFMKLQITSATVGDSLRIHPFTASYSASKLDNVIAQVANNPMPGFGLITITGNVFSAAWTGTPTSIVARESGYLL